MLYAEKEAIDAFVPPLRAREGATREEVARHGEGIADAGGRVEGLVQRVSMLATVQDVQLVVEDALVLWRALGALESKKVDAAELTALQREALSRAQLSATRAREAQRKLSERAAEEVEARAPDWEAVDASLRSHAEQFAQFQGMMKVLAQFVEDLVAKIAQLRGVDVDGLLAEPAPSAVDRPLSAPSPSPEPAAAWQRSSGLSRPPSAKAPWGAPNARPVAPVKKVVRRQPSPAPQFELVGQRT